MVSQFFDLGFTGGEVWDDHALPDAKRVFQRFPDPHEGGPIDAPDSIAAGSMFSWESGGRRHHFRSLVTRGRQ